MFITCKKRILHRKNYIFCRKLKGEKMKSYKQLTLSERKSLYETLSATYEEYKEKKLSLDLSRGKPNSSQLDISNGILSVDMADSYTSAAGLDCRNYGVLDGLPEMKAFFGAAMG